MIEVKNLTKIFKGKKEVIALDNVSFNVNEGEIFGYLGANGAGKTTTIKIMCSIFEKTSGEITLNEYDLHKQKSKCMEQIGAVLEGSRNIFLRLTVLQNLRFFANFRGKTTKEIKKKAFEYLELFDLLDKKNAEAYSLSRGMQQKVAICAALISDPKILFLDEPTLGLDVETAKKVENVIKYLAKKENKTIFLTSHNMGLIDKVCDRVAIIKKGKIIACDTVKSLKDFFSVSEYKINLYGHINESQEKLFEQIDNLKLEKMDGESCLTVDLKEGQEKLFKLLDLIRKENLTIKSLTTTEPDFEEIFLNIISKQHV